MRHDDATYGRDHRWIEGQDTLSTRVASCAGVEQAMRLDLPSKEAFSNV
jgi:hypothetical protein